MRTKQKRLLSIVLTLCMVVTLLPMMSIPAAAADTHSTKVKLNGKMLDEENPYLVNGAPSAGGKLGEGNCTAYFDAENGTLTLSGYNSGTITTYISLSDKGGDLTVKLEGENFINNGQLFATGKLTILPKKDGASLTVKNELSANAAIRGGVSNDGTLVGLQLGKADDSKKMTITATSKNGDGMSAAHGISILGATTVHVTVEDSRTGNARVESISSGRKMTIDTTGDITVTANATGTPYSCYALYAPNNLGIALENANSMKLTWADNATHSGATNIKTDQWIEIDAYGITNESDLTAELKTLSGINTVTYGAIHTITLDGVGEGVPETVTTAADGRLISEPKAGTIEGKVFLGWFADENHFGQRIVFPAGFDGDTTIYAKWGISESRTITLYDVGEGVPETVTTAADGRLISEPKAGTKDGMAFMGWFWDEHFSGPKLMFPAGFGENTTIYAKWITPTVINKIDITGVTDPVGGKTPDPSSTLPDGVRFSNTATPGEWFSEGDEFKDDFETGTKYTFEAYIVPEYGYIFDDSVIATINGQPADIDYSDEFGDWAVSLDFTAAEKLITEIRIYDVLEPIGGVKCNDFAYYAITGVDLVTGSFMWYRLDGEDLEKVGYGNKFVKGETYRYYATVEPKEGFTFATQPNFTINGRPAITESRDEEHYTGYIELAALEPISINNIEIFGVTKPVVGQSPEYTEYTEAVYYIYASGWYEADDDDSVDDMTFETDKEYILSLDMVTNVPYLFEESLTVTVNGEAMPPSDVEVSPYLHFPYRVSVELAFTAAEPVTTYTVTFESNGGSEVAAITNVTDGAKIDAPGTPTKTGYTFAGWYREEGLTTQWNFGTDTVTADTVLYAKWTKDSGGGGGTITTYGLTFETNGGSQIASVSRASGTVVDLSAYTPVKEGYEFAGWFEDQARTKAVSSITLNANKTVYAKWTAKDEPALELPFTDVAENSWFYDAVGYVHENGLMVGTSATAFSPNATTTRGMIVTILHRLEGTPAPSAENPFTDVADGTWYTDAVIWAAESGVVSGYGGGNFGPTDAVTREQMAVILMNYAKLKNYDVSAEADLSAFNDQSAISSWAVDTMAWANAEGLINGKGGGALDPAGNATRAEVAAILQRFIEAFVK
jgi:uncharacterized repeat protein (TIGR02543 family)